MATTRKTSTGRRTNDLIEKEQEGFGKAANSSEMKEGFLACSTTASSVGMGITDFTGATKGAWGGGARMNFVEWDTSPARSATAVTFTWIGGSQVRPVGDAFPRSTATLFVNGASVLHIPLGLLSSYLIDEGDFRLGFEPRRFQSLVEEPHRVWEPSGVSGFYRLTVPKRCIQKGEPLRLRVELDAAGEKRSVLFYVICRKDALRTDLTMLREQIAQLQRDMVQLTKSHEMLYAQVYPRMFPNKINTEPIIIHQDETKHYHPATVTVMSNGEVVVTAREATDHLANDGRMVLFRSQDNGMTWGAKELMFDLVRADHRSSPIFELPNGEWLTTDYRVGGFYNKDGSYDPLSAVHAQEPTQWGAWSSDKGRTWSFTQKPLAVPEAAGPYVEVERHMIQLPSGRLLAAGIYCYAKRTDGGLDLGGTPEGIAIFRSDDNGRSWEVHALLPKHPHTFGAETTILRTRSGKIIALSRTQTSGPEWMKKGCLLQSESHDDGKTWSELKPTPMSSMMSPAHLLQLRDGRILCTHASRSYPGSIYITASHDEGETWDVEHTRMLANDLQNGDSCYPTSGQLTDGSLITVWYGNLFGKFYIKCLRYRPEELDGYEC